MSIKDLKIEKLE